MSTAGWLVLIGFLAVIGGIWIFFTASRLDRLHARLDAAQSALDAQLVRRVAALRHAAESDPTALASGARPSGPDGPVLSAAERIEIERLVHGALTAAGPDRQVAENQVGRAVTDIASRGIALSRAQRDELHESAVRVSIARRFYNDAVRDTRSLRGRRMPRLLHLAGRRELPQFFDIDDTVPQELGTS